MKGAISTSGWVATVVCILLQAMLAPHIAIFGTTPLFLLIPLVLVTSNCLMTVGVAFAFLLGLLYDLGAGEPLGVMSLCLVLAATICQLAQDADSTAVPSAATIIACAVVVEVLQGILMCVTGFAGPFLDVFLRRMLLGALYTGVVTVVGVTIARALGARQRPQGKGPGSLA